MSVCDFVESWGAYAPKNAAKRSVLAAPTLGLAEKTYFQLISDMLAGYWWDTGHATQTTMTVRVLNIINQWQQKKGFLIDRTRGI